MGHESSTVSLNISRVEINTDDLKRDWSYLKDVEFMTAYWSQVSVLLGMDVAHDVLELKKPETRPEGPRATLFG